jgi:plastocyanin
VLKTALLCPTSCALLLLLPLVAGCRQSASAPAARTTPGKRVDSATAGTVSGRVVFNGTVPKSAKVGMSSDAFCGQANPGQMLDDSVIVGATGALQNVFVYVQGDLPAYAFDTPAVPVRLEQKGCRFSPHVIGLQVGQPLEVVSRDDTLHNVHAITKINDDFNIGATRGTVTRRSFAAPETMITFKCDVHGWMTAYAGVISHPYFAVTDADGRFAMKGLPPGDYVIAAWHEKFGTRTERVTVGPGERKEIAFTFKAT